MDDGKLQEAAAFAIEAHKGQTYGGRPYEYHLEQVAGVLREFDHGGDENLQIAAYLHDVVEDTPHTVDEIAARFGEDVAALVYSVTNLPGSRKERAAGTYAKIRQNARAVALKLADRISNVRESAGEENARLFQMYLDEYPGFRAILYRDGEYANMWAELDSLMR